MPRLRAQPDKKGEGRALFRTCRRQKLHRSMVKANALVVKMNRLDEHMWFCDDFLGARKQKKK